MHTAGGSGASEREERPPVEFAPGQPDPFSHERRTNGSDGPVLDTDKRRSVVELPSELLDSYGVKPGERAFANFYHEPADSPFWVARYRIEALERVYLQSVVPPLGRGYAHAQLRFDFADGQGPVLVPQDRSAGGPEKRVDKVVYSLETGWPRGESFQKGRAKRGGAKKIHRMTSLDWVHRFHGRALTGGLQSMLHGTLNALGLTALAARVPKPRETVRQFELTGLSDHEKRALFEYFIDRGTWEGESVPFSLLQDNCRRAVFDGLEAARPYSGALTHLASARHGAQVAMESAARTRRLGVENRPTLHQEFQNRQRLALQPVDPK